MTQKIAIILNPAAGRGKPGKHREKLERVLEETAERLSLPNNVYWSISETSGPGDAEKLARGAASYGFEVVAAAGGDGTLSEVLNGIVGTPAKLAVLPLGTGNDFARCIGIGTDLNLAAETLFIGDSQLIDIGCVKFTDEMVQVSQITTLPGFKLDDPTESIFGLSRELKLSAVRRTEVVDKHEEELEEVSQAPQNHRMILTPLEPLYDSEPVSDFNHAPNRYFLNIAGCGIDAMVADRVNAGFGSLKGRSAYLAALAQSLLTYRPALMTMTLDGEVREERAMLCCISNATSYGGGMRVTPNALLDDGLFDICLIKETSKIEFLRTFPKVYAGKHATHPKVEFFRARHAVIESNPPLPVLVDGEVIGMTPVELEIIPSKIEFLFPSN